MKGPTSYTLTVTQDTGANNGLATISGTKLASGQSQGDTLTLPSTLQLADGSSIIPLYSKSSLSYPAGIFSEDNSAVLFLGGFGDPILNLSQPLVSKWHERYPENFTITRLGMVPAVTLAHPLTLTIQARSQSVIRDLSDDATKWTEVHMLDIPHSAEKSSAKVYHWDSDAQEWMLYDSVPAVTETSSGDWLVQTQISALALKMYNSDFFAVNIERASSALCWINYK